MQGRKQNSELGVNTQNQTVECQERDGLLFALAVLAHPGAGWTKRDKRIPVSSV